MKYGFILPRGDVTGKVEMRPATPDEIRQMKAWIDHNRTATTPFDIVVEGRTPGDKPENAIDILRPYAEAGATWWLEAMWDQPSLESVLERIQQGPPKYS